MRRICFSVLLLGLLLSFSAPVYGQGPASCVLGKVKERARPRVTGQVSNGGIVEIAASFAPDGSVVSSKTISGPQQLRFDAEAYVRGWKAEASDELRQCVITVEFRLYRQPTCGIRSNNTDLQAEHVSDTHVILTRDCDGF